MSEEKRIFRDFDGREVEDLGKHVEEFIQNTDGDTDVYVGTDSQVHSSYTRYVTVVCLHDSQYGGAHVVYHGHNIHRPEKDLFNRLWEEVVATVEVANRIRNETHIDVNTHFDINPREQYRSHVTYKAARGFAESAGFDFCVKPEAWAATCAADRLN